MGMVKATYYINEKGEYIINYDGVDCAIIYQTYRRADRIMDVINSYISACKDTDSFKIVNIGQSGVRIEIYFDGVFKGGIAVWFNNYD